MHDVRVVLIGGTSNVGKSTVAQVIAGRLGFEYQSTDGLARHPGRPWRTPEREVPAHVAEHYRSRTVDELVSSLLDHYERLWPRIRKLVADHSAERGARAGLVLEGSGLWPGWLASLTTPRTAAVWLTADEAVIRVRMYEASRYAEATAEQRHLVDRFLARTMRFQTLMLEVVDKLGLDRIDAGGRSVEDLVDRVLTTVDAQYAIGRSGTR